MPADPPLRLGSSAAVLRGRNENDVVAAMTAWVRALSAESSIAAEPRWLVLRESGEVVRALRGRAIDALTLSLPEFADLPPGLVTGPYFRDEVQGTPLVRYALVAVADGPVRAVGDLRGARVAFHDGDYAEVARLWLDARLVAEGRARLAASAAKVVATERASACVLDVFFGRADACLVRQDVVAAAAELNPQVGKRLATVALSEPVAPSLFCFRAGVPEGPRDRLVQLVLHLHETVTGGQVMRVFRADQMAPLGDGEPERSVRLLLQWRQAVGERR